MTIATSVEYNKVKFIGTKSNDFLIQKSPKIMETSILYDIYRSDLLSPRKAVVTPAVNPAVPPAPKLPVTEESKKEKRKRKIRKLLTTPHQFFADSKNPLIKSMKVFFKKH